MRTFRTYAFLDGAYLRELGDKSNQPWVNPLQLAGMICRRNEAESVGINGFERNKLDLVRTVYYDAVADDETDVHEDLREYWEAIELLPDTHHGFGSLIRTPKGKRRQKGVDTLIAVDMLAGAFDRLFDLAVLIAGDADFVPVIKEVARRGVHIVLAGEPGSVSDTLRRASDRFVPFRPDPASGWWPHLKEQGRVWPRERNTP